MRARESDDIWRMVAAPAELAPLIAFDNSYARLPERFFARLPPTPVAAPRLIQLNTALAEQLGLDAEALATEAGVALLAGNQVPSGAEPIAAAYAGHQFGHFVPALGDGRAILLGEVVGRDGRRRDIQLKGAGPTPFSRRGDGRAALGPVLREYLVSEAMAALGVPTTRSLAAVSTGEAVFRETPLPGAVLTRIAASHIRVGTFQYFAARGDLEALRLLTGHAIARHHPEAEGPLGLLDAVVSAQARLVAQWLLIGFIHGVMNTDNMTVSGETIDYGPCAFLDAYDPAMVLSSIDHAGRYAYGNQPRIAAWNLARLAECLLPLTGLEEQAAVEAAQEVLARFSPRFAEAYRAGLARKLGLPGRLEGDDALGQAFLDALQAGGADFTLAFHALAEATQPAGEGRLRALFADPGPLDAWLPRWRARLDAGASARLAAVNPLLIPRNHLVEGAIAAAVERDDLSRFSTLLAAVTRPFDAPDDPALALPPRPDQRVLATFCGT